MVDDQDVDAFLEHHGIKGMHWGRRKNRRRSGPQSSADHARNRKRLQIAGVAGGLVATAFVSSVLARKGHISIKEANNQSAERMARIQRVVDKAVWQNPVHKNQADSLRDFVRRLS